MAIAKSCAAILQGMGAGGARGGKATVASPAAVNTMTINFPQPLSCGMCRVQAKGYNAGGGFVSVSVRGTDGTNFWDVFYSNEPVAGPGAAGDYISILAPFICDGLLTSITVILTLTVAPTGGTPVIDAEVWGAAM